MKNILKTLRTQEKAILKTAQQQVKKIRSAIHAIEQIAFDNLPFSNDSKPKKRRKMSAAARKAIGDAQRKRWAAQKARK